MISRESRIVGRDWQGQGGVWDEDTFRFLLTLEQRRSRRSLNPFVLMILNAMNEPQREQRILQLAVPTVASSIRETDLIGWIEKPSVLGIIFTQLDSTRTYPNMTIVQAKLLGALQEKLGGRMTAAISISSHIFTEPLETLQFDHSNAAMVQSPAFQ